jgi:hypothetical protein
MSEQATAIAAARESGYLVSRSRSVQVAWENECYRANRSCIIVWPGRTHGRLSVAIRCGFEEYEGTEQHDRLVLGSACYELVSRAFAEIHSHGKDYIPRFAKRNASACGYEWIEVDGLSNGWLLALAAEMAWLVECGPRSRPVQQLYDAADQRRQRAQGKGWVA